MKRSVDRILTTHAGSLPRPDDVLAMVQARAAGGCLDENAYRIRLGQAVADTVRQQVQLGIDVVDDGEMSKPGFIHYVNERLGGFEPSADAPSRSTWAGSREVRSFPEFYAWFSHALPSPAAKAPHLACVGPITYKGHALLKADLDNLRAALAGVSPAEVFVPAVSPSNVEEWHRNKHYKTDEEYLFAIADAMREEYRAIVDAGFLLQIDDPRLVTYYVLHPEASVADCRRWGRVRVAALNHALRGIPEDRVRFHTCYGINMGPRVHDMELKDVVDVILEVRAGAYSLEAANPRHEHEWRVWEEVKLPDGKILIPGVITQSSVLVEHPELVAQRIVRFASVVGRENVIAGSDCGFATFAGSMEIHPTVVWAKLAALAEGARLASRRLSGRP
ncbi:MAG TPA: cobalamin-independent methionine synthase II family protein [Solirubrobacterales bacterium]|nr:cobalamin-independent methionine synthase II family protein [Solirubrobacterales bacterium]